MGYYLMGDYYRGRAGDPGIGSFLGGLARKAFGVAGKVAGAVGAVAPGPSGMILRGVSKGLGGLSTLPQVGIPKPGGGGVIPFGQGGLFTPAGLPAELLVRRRRRMNPANPKALRRAIRREKAFIGLAKRVLRGTGITVSRRSVAAKRRRR